jgi:hypothetical protein
MNTQILKDRRVALAAIAGGVAYAFNGAIQATQDFGGTHNTIDSTGEYLVTGGFSAALFLTFLAYRDLARSAGRPKAGVLAMVPQLILAVLCIISVIRGEDLPIFNTVAPLCLLTWMAASIFIMVGLRKARAVPKAVAYAMPAILIATIPLSVIGGPLATGVFWIAVGSRSLRAVEPVVVPAAA